MQKHRLIRRLRDPNPMEYVPDQDSAPNPGKLQVYFAYPSNPGTEEIIREATKHWNEQKMHGSQGPGWSPQHPENNVQIAASFSKGRIGET